MSEQNTPPEPTANDVLPLLEAEGIDLVEVHFSGESDSGRIDRVVYYRGGEDVTRDYFSRVTIECVDGEWKKVRHEPARPMPTVRGSRTRWVTWGVTMKTEVRDFTVDEIIENHVYRRLSLTDVDYCNGDGGQGTYTLTRKHGGTWRFRLIVELNTEYFPTYDSMSVVESHTEYDSCGELSEETKQ